MSEYIDRAEALDAIHIALPDDGSVYRQGQNDMLNWVRETLLALPAVRTKAEDLRVAKWNGKYMDGRTVWECARCGAVEMGQSKYCPHCGARMRGGDKQ